MGYDAGKGDPRMSQVIPLELPDDVVQRAHLLASLTNRKVTEILA